MPVMSRILYKACSHRALFRALPARARSYATGAPAAQFDWEDPLVSKSLLTEDELAISETAERYCQERLLPRVLRTTAPSGPRPPLGRTQLRPACLG